VSTNPTNAIGNNVGATASRSAFFSLEGRRAADNSNYLLVANMSDDCITLNATSDNAGFRLRSLE